ncbi:hypothetical protein AJ79_01220 [Helicocarpus griseus UAMH5409]|uniref:Uncharacterized protein n=1 Tax=Helicocarpus griseus UAMH5409 TaxID=1447875 RepID=A0A2B7Y746_9EURO|nr:hypothetical protein AJ79_01220 [Helicocarpus griseus UAMH5409]
MRDSKGKELSGSGSTTLNLEASCLNTWRVHRLTAPNIDGHKATIFMDDVGIKSRSQGHSLDTLKSSALTGHRGLHSSNQSHILIDNSKSKRVWRRIGYQDELDHDDSQRSLPAPSLQTLSSSRDIEPHSAANKWKGTLISNIDQGRLCDSSHGLSISHSSHRIPSPQDQGNSVITVNMMALHAQGAIIEDPGLYNPRRDWV